MIKKNIAFITPIYTPAPLFGSDNAVRILAEELALLGHRVTIITSDALTPRYWYDPIFGKKIPDDAQKIINGIHIVRLPSNPFVTSGAFICSRFLTVFLQKQILNKLEIISSGPRLRGLEHILAAEKFDVIHCSPFPLYINAQLIHSISTLHKKPTIILTPFFHSSVPAYHNPQLLHILNSADVIHVVSYAEKFDIKTLFPDVQTRIETIPLFLQLSRLHTPAQLQTDTATFKKKYGLERKKIVLFAGLKGHMKGALDTLQATENIHAQDPNVALIAIGHTTAEWKSFKEKYHPKCLVDFNYVDDYMKEVIFNSCNVFCMPSKSESFGYVYLEAWHKYKPVIAASIGSTKELIGKSNGGLLVRYGDVADIQKSIKILLQDTLKSKTIGSNGHKLLQKYYNDNKIMPVYRRLFGV